MSITHTQLTTHQFTEAVKNTTPYVREKAGGLRSLMTSRKNIERMFEYYRQACRFSIDYIRQNPNISGRDLVMIAEILEK